MPLSGGCLSSIVLIFLVSVYWPSVRNLAGFIHIGITLRRMCKLYEVVTVASLLLYFYSRQLGVGLWRSCSFCSNILEALDYVMAKLDFNNAFNSLHRPDMLHAVADRLPEITQNAVLHNVSSALCFSVHILFHHNTAPIGAFLFCNTIQPLLLSLDSILDHGILHDVTLPQLVI